MSRDISALLRTVQLVQLTAFDASGELALDPMRRLTQRSLEAGISAFIPCAGSAEFHSMMPEEIVATIEMVRAEAGKEPVIIVPVGLQPKYAADLGKRALDAGADGVLVMPLSFPYVSDAGARDYYLGLMKQLECPTIIYKKDSVPSDDLLLELADHPQVVGVKYSVNEMDGVNSVIRRDGGKIDWFCGSAERYAPYFALAGSPGYTSGAGNICPSVTLAMHAALARKDWNEAMRLQQIMLPIEHYRARDNNSYNISFLKYAMQALGFDLGEPRAPYRHLTAEEKKEINEILPPILQAEEELAAKAS